jgi:HK97 family phage major capsid protein
MNEDQLKKVLDSINTAIDHKTAAIDEQIKLNGKAHEETSNEIKRLSDDLAKTAEHLAKMDAARQREAIEGNEEHSRTYKAFADALEGANPLAGLKSGKVTMDVKATMTTAANLLGDTIRPTRLNGVIYPATAPARMRDIMTVLPLSTSNAVEWVKETGYTNLAAPVTDNNNKPESEITLNTVNVPVQTIAHTMRLHKNMLADLPLLATYLTTRGIDGLLDEEDAQIADPATGTGVAPNLQSVFLDSLSAFDGTKLAAAIATGKTQFDVLRFAKNQVRNANLVANAIILNPDDLAIIETLKDGEDNYLITPNGNGMVTSIWRLPVIEMNAMKSGYFGVGAFNSAAFLFERQGITVEFFDQDRDNVQKNLVTVRIEERLACVTQRPEGIAYGQFATFLGNYGS